MVLFRWGKIPLTHLGRVTPSRAIHDNPYDFHNRKNGSEFVFVGFLWMKQRTGLAWKQYFFLINLFYDFSIVSKTCGGRKCLLFFFYHSKSPLVWFNSRISKNKIEKKFRFIYQFCLFANRQTWVAHRVSDHFDAHHTLKSNQWKEKEKNLSWANELFFSCCYLRTRKKRQ